MVRDLTDFHSTGNGNVAKLERVANIMGFNDSVANPFNLIACGFHFIGAVLYIFFYLYDSHVQANCPQPHFYYGSHYTFGGRAKFLTYLCMCTLLKYYIMAFLVDVLPILRYRFQWFIDWLFTAVIWPLSMVVCVFFWIIYAINRELIFPEIYDEYLQPTYINHIWHTAPLLLTIPEVVLIKHRRSSPAVAICTLGMVALSYATWLIITYNVTGIWTYSFLKFFSPLQFVLFVFFTFLFSSIFYAMQIFINNNNID